MLQMELHKYILKANEHQKKCWREGMCFQIYKVHF